MATRARRREVPYPVPRTVKPLRRTASSYLARRGGPSLSSALPPPDVSRYDPAHVAFAARAWTLKAEEEYRSAAVFAEIVAGCLHLGAPLDLTAALERVVRDEIAHATLCLDLSVRFGAPPPAAESRARPREALCARGRPWEAGALAPALRGRGRRDRVGRALPRRPARRPGALHARGALRHPAGRGPPRHALLARGRRTRAGVLGRGARAAPARFVAEPRRVRAGRRAARAPKARSR